MKMMKQISGIILCLMAVIFLGAGSPEKVKAEVLHSGTIDDTMEWSIDSDGLLTITGSGEGGLEEWPWQEYAEEITSAKVTVTGLTDMSYMFYDLWKLTSIDVSGIDTSKVTNMVSVFEYCSDLEEITGLKKWDTSKVVDMNNLFSDCYDLVSLDLNSWDTSMVENASGMFYNCEDLTSLTISKWDVSSLMFAPYMFYYCESLEELDLSDWKLDSLVDMYEMFAGCKNLSTDITLTCNPYSVFNCFFEAATADGAVITVTYTGDCSYVAAEAMVSTKSEESHVTLTNKPSEVKILYSGKDNNISWSIDNFGKLLLTGSGDYLEEEEEEETYPEWLDYCNYISSAQIQVTGMTNASRLFEYCNFLKEVDTSDWDTSKVTDMSSMFNGCSMLTTVDTSKWDTSKVTNMCNMFIDCSMLTTVDT